jgi:fimbrial chaperone protein
MFWRLAHRRVVLLMLLLQAGVSWAGSFSVSPVRVTLSAAAPIAALTVRNNGDEPALIQLEATAWLQQDGNDSYAPTRDLLATPPIFTVPARGAQVVRLGLRRAPDARRELTYRLYLQEVPAPPGPGFTGMRVALRLGVPVFVAPALASAQVLTWQLLRRPDGGLAVACLNDGKLHARIVSLTLVPAGGIALPPVAIATDVHAGQRREWPLAADLPLMPGTAVHLRAVTERGDADADLVLP